MKKLFLIFTFCLPFVTVSAQTDERNHAFQYHAIYAEEAPVIDGDLNDAIWQTASPLTNFTQNWPQDGKPATEHTEARIAYDENYIYFAFHFFDENAHLIRARNLERGGMNSRDDHAYIGLDTFMDGQNAYLFEMNALGTQDDAVIMDENLSYGSYQWDAVFYSETKIHDKGWNLEVAIPFRQLRFPKDDELQFGLMLSRMINRKNERVFWPYIGQEYGDERGALARVSQYGLLKGIKNVKRGKNIEFKPYVIGGVQEMRTDLSDEATDFDYNRDIGFDLKYGITSNLTLDLTVNTDFAQVEADNVQINLSRFSLFFPEKREFFQERAGIFEHGNSGSTQTFFSRRIGLTEQILAGARLTGQVGQFTVGLMNIETGDKMSNFLGPESSNNSVLRVRSNIFPLANIGAIVTNLEGKNHYNRALGFDANYRFWSQSQFNAWVTNVWDSNPANEDAAGHVQLSLANELYGVGFSYTNIGENYNPELGFVSRPNMRSYSGNLNYNPIFNTEHQPIRRLYISSGYEYIEDQMGNLETTNFSAGLQFELPQSDNFSFNYNRQYENLIFPFNIRPNAVIVADEYTFNRFSFNVETEDSRPVFFQGNISTGSYYGGDRTDFGVRVGYRNSEHLTLEGGFNHSVLDLPISNGEFDATTVSLNILAALNRKLFGKALIQYDNFSRNLQANIRLNWIHKPGSDLFLVYNTSYHFAGDNEDIFDPRRNLIMNNQIAIVKLTYLIML